MEYFIKRHISFFKVGFVGATGALLQAGVLFLIVESTHLYPVFANLIAIECAVVSNFTINNLWTFHKLSTHALPKRFFLFNVSVLGSVAVQTCILWAGIYIFGQSLYLLYTLIGIGVGWVLNYTVYTRLIWTLTGTNVETLTQEQ